MDQYEALCAAVLPIVPVCVPDQYTGEATVHCTYNATEIPEADGDDAPQAIRYLFQLHLFLPLGQDPRTTKRSLCRAIHAAGFTYPTVENASDGETQHYVFEFEGVDGDV